MEVREGGEGRGVRVEREGGRTGAWHPSMAVRASSTASREVRFPTPPHLHHMPTTTLVPTHPVTHGHALTFSCACVQERKGTAALALSHSRDRRPPRSCLRPRCRPRATPRGQGGARWGRRGRIFPSTLVVRSASSGPGLCRRIGDWSRGRLTAGCCSYRPGRHHPPLFSRVFSLACAVPSFRAV